MNQYLQQFREFSTEYLLERRALGEELVEDAHHAIELVLTERGEHIPPKPTRPIMVTSGTTRGSGPNSIKTVALLVAAVIAIGLAKAVAATWVGVALSIAILGYAVVDWLRLQNLSEPERETEELRRKAHKDGLTELMLSAASGDITRVRELIDYKADLNAKSLVGSTALMYAANNNQLAIVQFLLEAGADPSLRSDKGSTAADIALRAGHSELSRLLATYPASRQ